MSFIPFPDSLPHSLYGASWNFLPINYWLPNSCWGPLLGEPELKPTDPHTKSSTLYLLLCTSLLLINKISWYLYHASMFVYLGFHHRAHIHTPTSTELHISFSRQFYLFRLLKDLTDSFCCFLNYKCLCARLGPGV